MKKNYLGKFVKYYKKYTFRFITVLFASLIMALLSVTYPIITRRVFQVYVKENPVDFVKILVNDYITNTKELTDQAIGSLLGWIEIKTNQFIIFVYAILLVLTAILEKNKHRFRLLEKTWILLIVFGIEIISIVS